MTVYLADTHLVIWALDEFEKLTDAHAEIWTSDAEIWISYASVWEMTIKAALGKLRTPDDLVGTIMRSRLEALPIGLPHIDTLRALPPHHRDPFDRMLIAEARFEGMTIMTADRQFRAYDVAVI